MNGRKRSNEKSQKSIHSFFLQSKQATGKPRTSQVSNPEEPEQSQDQRCKGTKREREHESDDEVVCIDASPIAASKALQHQSGPAKAAKITAAVSKPVPSHVIAQDSLEPESSPVGDPSAYTAKCASVKAPNIPARDPGRHQLATRKFAISRRRFQLGDDEESCKKTAGKLTPLETQVVQLKKQNPGFVLLVECGYKFRLFERDAEIAAAHLNIYSFADHNFMTASIPVHRLHVYVRRLVKKGYKVAVARQMETAALKKAGDNRNKVFERKVTAVYTPATLEAGASEDVGELDVAGSDTAQAVTSFLLALSEGLPEGNSDGQTGSSMLESALLYFQPREVLCSGELSKEAQRTLKAFAETQEGCSVETVDRSNDSHQAAKEGVCDLLSLACQAQDNFTAGLEELPFGVVNAMHGAFTYLGKLGLNIWNEVGLKLVPVSNPGHMTLGSNALHNLHILTGEDAGTLKGSLVHLLDRTKTKSGSRLLRQWLVHPLVSSTAICERQDAVQSLLDNVDLVSTIREVLAKCPDVDRAVGRIFLSRSSPSEFLRVMQCLSDLPTSLLGKKDGLEGTCDLSEVMPGASIELQTLLQSVCDAEMVKHAREQLSLMNVDAAANNKYTDVLTSEDRFPQLFACRKALADAEGVLQGLLPAIAKQAGVNKVGFTSILNQGDFLIELAVDIKPPKDWHKVCSTKKVHRWRPPQVTAAVAEREQASERLQVESKRAWKQMLEDCSPHCRIFRAAAHALAAIDCLQAFAAAASDGECCRPEILDESVGEAEISISNGRCPTLDAVLPQGAVPNDVELRGNELRAMVISGPNMGGKSSYMCQVGQLVVMAQAGLWVPAQRMRLRPADAIFTRMGAYDSILQGRSTFLEELRDASALLAAATPSSLVIVDELGRGTATHDGVAIAVSTLQHLVVRQKCCTLYSTHYPEVCEAAQELKPHADCFHMSYDTTMWELQRTSHSEPDTTLQDTQMRNVENDAPNGAAEQRVGEKEQVVSKSKQFPQVQRVVFLFKLVRGATGASFGLNVAMMAGLPHSVVAKASLVAKGCKTAEGGNEARDACRIQGHQASLEDVANCRRDNTHVISEQVREVLKSVFSLPEASGADRYLSLQDSVRQLGNLGNA